MSFLGDVSGKALSAVSGVASSIIPGPAGKLLSAGAQSLGSTLGVSSDRDYASQLWDKQNAYNDPSQQVARLRKAGLNPAFALGSGAISSGNAVSQQQMSGAIDPNSQMNNYVQMMNAMTQRSLMDSQKDLNESEADLNRSKAQTESTQQNLNITSSDKNVANTALMKLQSINQDLENKLLAEFGGKQKASEINSLVASATKDFADAKLAGANINLVAAHIAEAYAHAHNLDVNSTQVRSLTPYIIANLGAQTAGKLIENSIGQNELNWQNGSDSNGQSNYAKLRGLQLQGVSNEVYGKTLQNDAQSQQNSTYYLDKILNAVTSIGSLGIGAGYLNNLVGRQQLTDRPTKTESYSVHSDGRSTHTFTLSGH